MLNMDIKLAIQVLIALCLLRMHARSVLVPLVAQLVLAQLPLGGLKSRA